MKALNCCILIVISLILIPNSSFGESPSLFVAGVDLKIGMSEKEVKDKFKLSNYNLQKMGEYKAYGIVSKTGPPYEILGNIAFDNKGKLDWVGKEWGTYNGTDAVSMGKAIYNCFQKQQNLPMTFQTLTHAEPGFISYSLVIYFSNGKEITIATFEGEKTDNQVTLQEGLKK